MLASRRPAQVVKRKGDKADQKFNLEIGLLINKRLSDFDALGDAEINNFRRDTVPVCQARVAAGVAAHDVAGAGGH